MLLFPIKTIISEYINKYPNKKNSRIEKDLLLIIAKIKKTSYEDLFFFPEKFFLNKDEKLLLGQMMVNYEKNMPISKIINKKSFWIHDFFVNEYVLDPRQETELIIEAAISLFNTNEPLNILDIGTGSGCILLSLMSEFQHASGMGIDISEKAVIVAEFNKKCINVPDAKFLNMSLEEFYGTCTKKFEMIVCNPPYVKSKDIDKLDDMVKNFDPREALDGGEDGLQAYRNFSPLIRELLAETGVLLLELGFGQAANVKTILQGSGLCVEKILEDFAGIERVVIARKANLALPKQKLKPKEDVN